MAFNDVTEEGEGMRARHAGVIRRVRRELGQIQRSGQGCKGTDGCLA